MSDQTTHELKTWPAAFAAMLSGAKTGEFRKDDRPGGFQLGDLLRLREYDPDTDAYSGREMTVKVTDVQRGPDWGVPAGYAAMSTQRKDGATLIAEERRRQIEAEEWTAEHDDLWDYCELAMAAMCYVAEDIRPKGHELCYRMTNPQITGRAEPALWPWHARWWKPKDRIRNLVRAGALIAAEIDRLQRTLEAS